MKLLLVLSLVIVVGVACVTALPNAARVRERRHEGEHDEDDGDHDDHNMEVPCNNTIVGNTTQPCVNTGHGATKGRGFSSFPELFDRYQGVIYRAMIVFGAVAGIILIYVSVRCIRRRQATKTRKYGLITTPDDKLELRPLEEDEDSDDDMTVFDRTKPSSAGGRPINNNSARRNKSRPNSVKVAH